MRLCELEVSFTLACLKVFKYPPFTDSAENHCLMSRVCFMQKKKNVSGQAFVQFVSRQRFESWWRRIFYEKDGRG